MTEIEISKKPRSLGESVDILRKDIGGLAEDIKELYELDEDNYQAIKTLRTALDKALDRLQAVEKAIRKVRRKHVLLGIAAIGGLWLLAECWKNEVRRLEEEIEVLQDAYMTGEDKTSEESDG